MKKTVRSGFVALVFVAVVAVVFVAIAAFRVRSEAKAALTDLRMLQGSDDPSAGFELLKRKYGNELRPTQGCLPQDCQYAMTISNRSISVLHLVPYAN